MRAVLLLVLVAWLGLGSGSVLSNVMNNRNAVSEHAVPSRLAEARAAVRRLPLARRLLRPAGIVNGTRGPSGAAMRAVEETSHALWMRYTHPRPFRVLDQKIIYPKADVVQGSLLQPLDHLDKENTPTWKQVYYRNRASLVKEGPVFVMLSGTTDYDPTSDWLRAGHMAELGQRLGADMYFLPTRFFDLNNPPTLDTSTKNLLYLSTEQILQDVVHFLEYLQDNGDMLQTQKVILFGAGYAGAIATWARQRFPDIVQGVVASSPTLEAKYDTYSYFPVVSLAIKWYHSKDFPTAPNGCEPLVRQAFEKLETNLNTKDGRKEFNLRFNPCTPIPEDDVISVEDRAQVLGVVASVFADAVQEDEDGPNDNIDPGGDKLWPICTLLVEAYDTPFSMLGLMVSDATHDRCLETSFQGLARKLVDGNWTSEANQMGVRPWLWLQCTELGHLPTSASSPYEFPYSTRINMAFYRKMCENAFGPDVNKNLVRNIADINRDYGGKTPDVSNAIFIRGDLDPWRDLSPGMSLQGDEVHVFNVLRASHAHDMYPRDDYDPPWMKKTRKEVDSILTRWL